MKSKPKIALVANTSWNLYNFRLPLANELSSKGYEVIFIAPKDRYSDIIGKDFSYFEIKKLSRKGVNPLEDIALLLEFYRILKKEKVNYSIFYTIKPNIFGSIASRVSGVKSIATITGLGYTFINDNWVNKVVQMLYKIGLGCANHIFFQNPDDRDLFLKKKLVSVKKSSVVNGSGIDIDFFKFDRKPRNTDDIFKFLFVGRLLIDKGIRELLEAGKKLLEEFPNKIEIHLVGDLDTEGNPKALPKHELDEALKTKGFVYHGYSNKIKELIESSDAVVLPSYREGVPRVLLEAISLSTPIVATDVPGCREVVVNKENGFSVKEKDSEDLYYKLKEMYLLNSQELIEMGKKGRILAENKFSMEKINTNYIKLLNTFKV